MKEFCMHEIKKETRYEKLTSGFFNPLQTSCDGSMTHSEKPPKDIRVHESQESSLFPCTHNCRTMFSLRTKFFGNVNVTASSNVRAVKNEKFFFVTFLSIPIPFNLFSGKHQNTITLG